MISGLSSDTTYEQTEKLKSGEYLFGDRGAAEHMAPFQHEHALPRAGEVGGAGEAIVAAPDDDDVVLHDACGLYVRRTRMPAMRPQPAASMLLVALTLVVCRAGVGGDASRQRRG